MAEERSGKGAQGPAAGDGLERFEGWLERRWPEPRSAAATLLLAAVRLMLGRLAWVVGAFLVAMALPWFVFFWRELSAVGGALAWKLFATERTEARIAESGVRLAWPEPGQGAGLRAEPYLVVSLSQPGSGALLYRPFAGVFELPLLERTLFVTPPALGGGRAIAWRSGPGGAPGLVLRTTPGERQRLMTPDEDGDIPWQNEVVAALDRPLDLLLSDWTRPASAGESVPVRHRSGRPQQLFVDGALEAVLAPGQAIPALVLLLLLAGFFGGPFFHFGMRLLSRGLAAPWRRGLPWAVVLSLPLWGDGYLRIVERLAPGIHEGFGMLAARTGWRAALPASQPFAPQGEEGIPFDLVGSRHAALLAGVDLSRPSGEALDADAAWRTLVARFDTAYAARSDAELAAAFDLGVTDAHRALAIAPALLEPARRVLGREASSSELRERARALLVATLATARWPLLCDPGYAAQSAQLTGLAGERDPEVAAAARARLDELAGFEEARRRDWGRVCD